MLMNCYQQIIEYCQQNTSDVIIGIIRYFAAGIVCFKLFNSYLGFIPFVGDIISVYKIGDRYENPSGKKYFLACVSMLLFSLLVKILNKSSVIGSLIFKDKEFLMTSMRFGMDMLMLFIVIIWAIAVMVYFYQTVTPLLKDIRKEESVGGMALLFTIFPIICFIYLILKADDANRNFEDRINDNRADSDEAYESDVTDTDEFGDSEVMYSDGAQDAYAKGSDENRPDYDFGANETDKPYNP